jgi:hypothetical protein
MEEIPTINYKTIDDTEPTNVNDESSSIIADSFKSGAEGMNITPEGMEKFKAKRDAKKAARQAEKKDKEIDDAKNNVDNNDATITNEPAPGGADKKNFTETAIGKGLGKIGKFLTFWKKK